MTIRSLQPRTGHETRKQILLQQRRSRRRLVTAWALAGLVLAGVFGFGVYQAQRVTNVTATQVPAHSSTDRTGIVVSSGPVRVDVYLDYLCPACRSTENAMTDQLTKLASSGRIELVYHPLGHLDGYSDPPGYSTRAAAAAGCAADADRFSKFTVALYAHQPDEHTAGLSADQLIDLGGTIGITDPNFAACVRDGTYTSWVKSVTQIAYSKNVAATPTILVAGKPIDVTPRHVVQTLNDAVQRQ